MRITIRLFATFRNGRGKFIEADYQDGTSCRGVLETLNIPPEEVAILLINGRDGDMDGPLSNGDVLSLFPPVGGG